MLNNNIVLRKENLIKDSNNLFYALYKPKNYTIYNSCCKFIKEEYISFVKSLIENNFDIYIL